MSSNLEYKVELDIVGHKEIIEFVGVQTLVVNSKAKADRIDVLLERFEDNINSIDFINLRLKSIGIVNKRYVLEANKLDLLDSNERIVKALNNIIK